jgi:hypothetical protein
LSSTIRSLLRAASGLRHSSERGQVLVIFAGGLVTLIAVAALVFDTGQSLLDKRTEVNAADAASLAGARYVTTASGVYNGACPLSGSFATDPNYKHVQAACDTAIAYLNAEGFNNRTITIKSPPGSETLWSGIPKYIEVNVDSTRPSFFAGVLGLTTQHTGALAVAGNNDGFSLPYSLLSLDPTGCSAGKVSGGGIVTVGGTIHIDSNCPLGAFLISGSGAVTAPACDAVGDIQVTGGGSGCSTQHEGAAVSGDPLAGLSAPAIPTTLGSYTLMPGETKTIPPGCASYAGGVLTATISAPITCSFGSSFAGHSYRMSPGYYPGGINLNAGIFYMEPGIYYLGGGGFRLGGNGVTIKTVDTGTTTFGGGILIFDSAYSNTALCTGTGTGGIGSACIGDISMDGGGATADLKPIQTTIYKNMLIFVDRITTSPRVTLTLNGSATTSTLEGTIYAPTGIAILNGNGADSIASQVISYDFKVNGNTGNLTVTYDSDKLFKLTGVGLVQ